MLTFISDLHLRDDQSLTIESAQTEGFLRKSLIPLIKDAGATEVTVVFLGDFVDINRSPYWIEGSSKKNAEYVYVPWSHWRDTLRHIAQLVKAKKPPTGDPHFDSREFEEHVIAVLHRIRDANKENLDLWHKFKTGDSSLWAETSPPRVAFEFIPGNHDRLAQYSEATRRAMISSFHLDHDPAEPFRWVGHYPEYRAVALHGHLLSRENFGGKEVPADPGDSPWYDVPALGDVVTSIFGVGVVHRLLQLSGDADIAHSVNHVDLVRPQAAAFQWLSQWGLSRKPELQHALDQAVLRALDEFLANDFVKWWDPIGGWGPGKWIKQLRMFLRKPRTAKSAFRLFEQLYGGPKTLEEYTDAMVRKVTEGPFADWLRANHQDARYIVSGHTHRPAVIPLSGCGTPGGAPIDECFYFNSGTWLDVVEQAKGPGGGFAQRNQITHVTFYRDGEDPKPDGCRSYWEYWQGDLKEGPASTVPA